MGSGEDGGGRDGKVVPLPVGFGPDQMELRSFGRRKGRKLSEHQTRLLDDVLPRVALPGAGPIDLAGAVFPAGVDEVWLEIGFGGGEHLVQQARLHSDVGIIGCEPFIDGVVKVLAEVEAGGLDRVRLYADDARDLVRRLPEASIARVFVLFPDPWPKRKHQKRRLVNGALLAEICRILKPGGELRLGTDIADYARTMLMAIQREPRLVWTARRADDWRVRPDDWPKTRYEAKAEREGRCSSYLMFRRA